MPYIKKGILGENPTNLYTSHYKLWFAVKNKLYSRLIKKKKKTKKKELVNTKT